MVQTSTQQAREPDMGSLTVEIFPSMRPFRPIWREYLDSERYLVTTVPNTGGRE